MFLSGDRNWASTPTANNYTSQYVNFGTNTSAAPLNTASWNDKVHQKNGNVTLSDGSVQQVSVSKTKDMFRNTGDTLNTLVFP